MKWYTIFLENKKLISKFKNVLRKIICFGNISPYQGLIWILYKECNGSSKICKNIFDVHQVLPLSRLKEPKKYWYKLNIDKKINSRRRTMNANSDWERCRWASREVKQERAERYDCNYARQTYYDRLNIFFKITIHLTVLQMYYRCIEAYYFSKKENNYYEYKRLFSWKYYKA